MNKKQALMSGDRCQVLLIAAALLWPNYGYAQPNLLDAFKSLIQGIQGAPNQQATRSLRSQEPFVEVDNKLKQCSSSSPYHLCWGDFTFSDGYTYVGMWAHDKRDGLGTSIAPDGVQYFGLWKGGRPEKLIKFNPSGVVADSGVYDYTYKLLKYEKLEPVDFLARKKQLPHEAAKKITEQTAPTTGQCPRNVPSYQWTDCIGSVNYGKATYEGEYKDGVRSGKGTLSWNDGGVINSGIWSKDEFLGPIATEQIGQLPPCQGENIPLWHECFGDISKVPKDKRDLGATFGAVNFQYVGEFESGLPHGRGTYKNAYGQTYEGAFRAGKFYGEGVFYSSVGEIIGSGTWINDLLVKRHDVVFVPVSTAALNRQQESGSSRPLPSCQGFKNNCFGTLIYGSGDRLYGGGGKYIGEFKDGKEHGQGTRTRADGSKYVGEFKEGKFNGKGTLVYADGSKYVGEFKDGSRDGRGAYTELEGHWKGIKYFGQWSDDKRNGEGIEFIGTQYKVGLWQNGKFIGSKNIDLAAITGIPSSLILMVQSAENERVNKKVAEPSSKESHVLKQIFASTYPPCEGALIARWNNCVGDTSKANRDARDSSGSWTVPRIALAGDNFRYNGEFKDGLPHGRGVYLTSRGQRYEGEFKEGKFYGEGIFYSERGEVISSGTWKNDALLQKHEVSLAKLNLIEPGTVTSVATGPQETRPDDVPRSEPPLEVGISDQERTAELDRLRAEAERAKQEKAELEAQLAAVQQAQTKPVAPVGPALKVHAIVIGNGAYQGSGRLENPINDARAISAKLKRMGFKVTLVENADRNKLVSSLVKFSSSAADSDLTLFFYAGHGVQISGTNYMLPTDTNLNQIGGVPLHGISLNSVVEQFLPGKTKLVFLDACRDNPLLQVASRSVSRGLAPISVSQGTLISYATKDGSVAADGDGKNSPFTKALLQFIDDPDDIAVVLRKVRDQVMRDTGGQQQPWEYGSLSGGSLILSAIKAK